MRYHARSAILQYTYLPCRVPVTYVGWSARHEGAPGQQSTLACSPQDPGWYITIKDGPERVHNSFSSVHITGVQGMAQLAAALI